MRTQKSVVEKWRALRRAVLTLQEPHRLEGLPRWKRLPRACLCVATAVVRDLLSGELTLRAMSLVYTTLLSLVPLLAIGFSMLKALGVHNRVEPALAELLEPLGERGQEITARIIEFVDNIQVGVLGFLGLLLLLYTVVSLLQKVEHALNFIWHVPSERRMLEKVRDYLSAVIVGPLLLIAATGVIASLMSSQVMQTVTAFGPLGDFLAFAGRLTSLLLIIAAFTFLYMFLPNTRVHLKAALAGGGAAGLLWIVVGWGFATFIAGSARYTAIYSAFATLIFFLIWLYLVWLIVLLGSAVSFYVQNPQYIGVERNRVRYAIALTEKSALLVLYHIVGNWYRGEPPPTADDLARVNGLPEPLVLQVGDTLERAGFIEHAGDREGGYLPARPPETTNLASVLEAVRQDEGDGHPAIPALEEPAPLRRVCEGIDLALRQGCGGLTLKAFALSGNGEPGGLTDAQLNPDNGSNRHPDEGQDL